MKVIIIGFVVAREIVPLDGVVELSFCINPTCVKTPVIDHYPFVSKPHPRGKEIIYYGEFEHYVKCSLFLFDRFFKKSYYFGSDKMESLLDSKILDVFPTPESSIIKTIAAVQTEKIPSWKKTSGGEGTPSHRRSGKGIHYYR